MRRRLVTGAAAIALVVAACGGSPAPSPGSVAPLPPITPAELSTLVSNGTPSVVNVWASWCGPCRSEAPLLAAASGRFGGQVQFIGIDVQDQQAAAQSFIAEFGLTYPNYFDPARSIPNTLGGIGVPITYFFSGDGVLKKTHIGIIDEQTLALGIDELLGR